MRDVEVDVHVQHIAIARTGQDVTYTELLRIDWSGPIYQCRIRICSNAHREQSSAVIEHYDGAWQEVYTIAPGAMLTETGLYLHGPLVHLSVFRGDRDFLLARAVEILR
jgi:hypothetical protein